MTACEHLQHRGCVQRRIVRLYLVVFLVVVQVQLVDAGQRFARVLLLVVPVPHNNVPEFGRTIADCRDLLGRHVVRFPEQLPLARQPRVALRRASELVAATRNHPKLLRDSARVLFALRLEHAGNLVLTLSPGENQPDKLPFVVVRFAGVAVDRVPANLFELAALETMEQQPAVLHAVNAVLPDKLPPSFVQVAGYHLARFLGRVVVDERPDYAAVTVAPNAVSDSRRVAVPRAAAHILIELFHFHIPRRIDSPGREQERRRAERAVRVGAATRVEVFH